MKFLRPLLGITKLDKEKNQSIRKKTGAQNISGYNMYRGWVQTDCHSRHCAIDRKDEGTRDDRRKDGLTRFTSRFREQATRLATPLLNMMMMMLLFVLSVLYCTKVH
jgi:hypothetical protein